MNEQNKKTDEKKDKAEASVLKSRSYSFRVSEGEEARLQNLLEKRNSFFGNVATMSDFLREQVLKDNKAYELKKMNITLETLALELKQFNEYIDAYGENSNEFFSGELLKTISADLKRACSLYDKYLKKEMAADFLSNLLNSLSVNLKEALKRFEEYQQAES